MKEIVVLLVFHYFTFVTSEINCDIVANKCGVLVPTDPNAVIGKSLRITCTLNQTFVSAYEVDSSAIIFKIFKKNHTNQVYKKKNLSILDNLTTRLEINKVELEPGTYHVSCVVRKKNQNSSPKEFTQNVVTRELMFVGFEPYQPRITDMYIENWTNFSVIYKKSGKNKYFLTKYSTWFSQSSGGGVWKKCHTDGTESCKVNNTEFNIYEQRISAKVNGSNLVGNITSTIVTKKIKELVIPGKVLNVRYKAQKRSIQITFDSPKPSNLVAIRDINVTYQFTCSNQTFTHFTNKMKDINFNLTSLQPYRNYSVGFRSQAEGSERWSSAHLVSMTTKQDVPDKPPIVTPGSFFVKIKHSDNGLTQDRDIILFWKSVPKEYRNGVVTEYSIYTQCDTKEMSPTIVPVEDSYKEMSSYMMKNLALDKEYIFFIHASTTIGYNKSLHWSPLIVPAQSSIAQDLALKFVAIDEERVEVSWKAEDTNITVFWCKGHFQQPRDCSDEISWYIINGNKGKTVLYIPGGPSGRMFGSSVLRNGHPSGIKWTECLYHVIEASRPPNYEILKITYDSIKLRLRKPPCSVTLADIDHYRVIYCVSNDNGKNKCQRGTEKVVLFSIDPSERYSIDNLQGSQAYILNLQSIARSVPSFNITFSCKTPSIAFHKNYKYMVPILIVVGIIVVVSLLGIIYCLRNQWQRCKQYFLPVYIKPPDESIKRNFDRTNDILTEGEVLLDYKSSNCSNESDATVIVQTRKDISMNVDPHYEYTSAASTFKENDFNDLLIIKDPNQDNKQSRPPVMFNNGSVKFCNTKDKAQEPIHCQNSREPLVIDPSTLVSNASSNGGEHKRHDSTIGYAHTNEYTDNAQAVVVPFHEEQVPGDESANEKEAVFPSNSNSNSNRGGCVRIPMCDSKQLQTPLVIPPVSSYDNNSGGGSGDDLVISPFFNGICNKYGDTVKVGDRIVDNDDIISCDDSDIAGYSRVGVETSFANIIENCDKNTTLSNQFTDDSVAASGTAKPAADASDKISIASTSPSDDTVVNVVGVINGR